MILLEEVTSSIHLFLLGEASVVFFGDLSLTVVDDELMIYQRFLYTIKQICFLYLDFDCFVLCNDNVLSNLEGGRSHHEN